VQRGVHRCIWVFLGVSGCEQVCIGAYGGVSRCIWLCLGAYGCV
jgi:hypothetical protein